MRWQDVPPASPAECDCWLKDRKEALALLRDAISRADEENQR
jgi:hypothetical protein